MARIRIQYYAVLREQRGETEETLDSSASTALDLYREIRARHGLTLPEEMLRVVVNEEFAEWDAALQSGDTVVFIPPVAGG